MRTLKLKLSKGHQFSAIQYSGRVIKYAGYMLILYVVLARYVITVFGYGGNYDQWLTDIFLSSDAITRLLQWFVPPAIMIWLGAHLEKISDDRKDALNNQLIGLLKSYSRMPISELGTKVGLSPTDTEKALAMVRANSALDIAMADGEAALEREICKTCPHRNDEGSFNFNKREVG